MATPWNRLGKAVLTCTHNQCFKQKYEKYQNFSTENLFFYNFKNLCILHGYVFVMTENLARHTCRKVSDHHISVSILSDTGDPWVCCFWGVRRFCLNSPSWDLVLGWVPPIGDDLALKQMSHLMGKPKICIGENKDADQLRGNRYADQRLCFRYTDSTLPLLLKSDVSSF